MEQVLWISFGAVLGANAAFLGERWHHQSSGATFPYGTFIINLSGSLLLGFFWLLPATGRGWIRAGGHFWWLVSSERTPLFRPMQLKVLIWPCKGSGCWVSPI